MTWRAGPGLGAALAVVALAGGCTGQPGGGTAVGSSTAARPATGAAAPDGFGTRRVLLGCADSVGAAPSDVAGVTRGDPPVPGLDRAAGPLPRAEDVGLRLPDGLHWYFRKDPLVLLDGAPDVTITASGPGQALAWVPASVWMSGGKPDLTSWAAASVTLRGCRDRAALFLGGVLAAEPTTCVRLTIRTAGRAARTVNRHLDGSPCSG